MRTDDSVEIISEIFSLPEATPTPAPDTEPTAAPEQEETATPEVTEPVVPGGEEETPEMTAVPPDMVISTGAFWEVLAF